MRLLTILLLWLVSVSVFAEETAVAAEKAPAAVVAGVAAKPASPAYNPPDTTAALLKVTVGLGLVVVAIFVSAWAFRRFAGNSFISNDSMRVVTGLSMGARDRIILLQVGKEQIVVGISPGRMQTLHVMKEPLEIDADETSAGAVFADKFSAALKQWKKS